MSLPGPEQLVVLRVSIIRCRFAKLVGSFGQRGAAVTGGGGVSSGIEDRLAEISSWLLANKHSKEEEEIVYWWSICLGWGGGSGMVGSATAIGTVYGFVATRRLSEEWE